jgi:hypothetical protein
MVSHATGALHPDRTGRSWELPPCSPRGWRPSTRGDPAPPAIRVSPPEEDPWSSIDWGLGGARRRSRCEVTVATGRDHPGERPLAGDRVPPTPASRCPLDDRSAAIGIRDQAPICAWTSPRAITSWASSDRRPTLLPDAPTRGEARAHPRPPERMSLGRSWTLTEDRRCPYVGAAVGAGQVRAERTRLRPGSWPPVTPGATSPTTEPPARASAPRPHRRQSRVSGRQTYREAASPKVAGPNHGTGWGACSTPSRSRGVAPAPWGSETATREFARPGVLETSGHACWTVLSSSTVVPDDEWGRESSTPRRQGAQAPAGRHAPARSIGSEPRPLSASPAVAPFGRDRAPGSGVLATPVCWRPGSLRSRSEAAPWGGRGAGWAWTGWRGSSSSSRSEIGAAVSCAGTGHRPPAGSRPARRPGRRRRGACHFACQFAFSPSRAEMTTAPPWPPPR